MEKHACFSRGSSYRLLSVCLNLPSPTDSPLCQPQELGSGSKREAQLSMEPQNPCMPGPHFLAPSPLTSAAALEIFP